MLSDFRQFMITYIPRVARSLSAGQPEHPPVVPTQEKGHTLRHVTVFPPVASDASAAYAVPAAWPGSAATWPVGLAPEAM